MNYLIIDEYGQETESYVINSTSLKDAKRVTKQWWGKYGGLREVEGIKMPANFTNCVMDRKTISQLNPNIGSAIVSKAGQPSMVLTVILWVVVITVVILTLLHSAN